MKKFKGIRGQWYVKNIFRKPEVITDISNQTVCLIKEVWTVKIRDDDSESNIGQSHNEMMATAKLIAAAPELLEALHNLCESFDKDGLSEHQLLSYWNAKKAINKAL